MDADELKLIAQGTADVVRKHMKPTTMVNYPAPHVQVDNHLQSPTVEAPVTVNMDVAVLAAAQDRLSLYIKDCFERLSETMRVQNEAIVAAVNAFTKAIAEQKLTVSPVIQPDVKVTLPKREKRQIEMTHPDGGVTILREK